MITILGLVAGALTTASFIPQVLKAWKTKHTKDLSLPMYVILTVGIFSWLVYGFLSKDLPVFLTNIVVFGLSLSILVMKLSYG